MTWKAIKNFEGFYEVSTEGQIRSLDRIVEDTISPCKRYPNGHKRQRKMKGKMLVPTDVSGSGHLSVGLFSTQKARRTNRGSVKILVHRAVAQTFIPNPDNKPVVDHIDGNPRNNHVDNLRWVTYHENNNNTHYTRYLQEKLKRNNIEYMSEKEYYEEKVSSFR